MNRLLTSTLAASLAAIVMAGCTDTKASETMQPQSSKAIFRSFVYEGNDDYYAENPLADANTFYNPVLPGWYSDPSVCTNGQGDYFLATSTFTYFPGVPLFHSRDLMHWRKIGHILSRPSQLENLERQHVSGGIFAPAIAYNPANKTYYMVTTNVGKGNFFVKTTDPFGEWSDPIMLPEVAGIDPAFFFDEDGKGYIVNNDDAPDYKPEYPGHRTVRVVEFDPATDRCVGERRIVVNKGCRPDEKPIWCEGPHIYKINGEYYLMTAEGGTSTCHSEVIYRGKSPFGPYTPWEGNPMLTQRTMPKDRENPVTCAGHADIIEGPDGQWWGVFLACRPVEGDHENLGRETFMMPVKWTDDGWPYMTREGEAVPMQIHNASVTRNDAEITSGNFVWEDQFTDSTLDMEWMTLRGPATQFYSLSANPGALTLKCADCASTEKAELPMVCRRIQHHKFAARTDLVFRPEHEGQCAGMVLMKDETHQYQLVRTMHADSLHCVSLRRVGENGPEELAYVHLDEGADNMQLKVEADGLKFAFHCSTDGGKTWKEVARDVDARYTSTATAGGFTGTTLGLYASNI